MDRRTQFAIEYLNNMFDRLIMGNLLDRDFDVFLTAVHAYMDADIHDSISTSANIFPGIGHDRINIPNHRVSEIRQKWARSMQKLLEIENNT